jgi:DNA polymerase-3 subunit gamma/tau
LGLIARAAEGSVRDSLSLLDQAIAHAAGTVRAEDVRQMLGLADRTRIIDLFASLASGDIAAAFKEFRDQYDTGADPVVVLSDLAEFVNFVTRVKVLPATADNLALGETERTRGRDFAAKLSMRVLSRMWQMLLKGITEVQAATRPQAAAEMVLVRIAYVADLPTPDEAIKMIDQGGGSSPTLGGNVVGNASPRGSSAMQSSSGDEGSQLRAVASSTRPALDTSPRPQMSVPAPAPVEAAPARRLTTFAELVALAGEKRDLQIKAALEADVRLVRMEDGKLEVSLERSAARSMIQDLSRKLEQWTGRRWTVAVSNEAGQPTLRAQAQVAKDKLTDGVQADPRVQAVMSRFPGTQLVEVRRIAPDNASGDDETGPVAAAEEDDDL